MLHCKDSSEKSPVGVMDGRLLLPSATDSFALLQGGPCVSLISTQSSSLLWSVMPATDLAQRGVLTGFRVKQTHLLYTDRVAVSRARETCSVSHSRMLTSRALRGRGRRKENTRKGARTRITLRNHRRAATRTSMGSMRHPCRKKQRKELQRVSLNECMHDRVRMILSGTQMSSLLQLCVRNG